MLTNSKSGRSRSADEFSAPRPSVSTAIGYEVHEFLALEALLLDNRRY